MKTETIVAISTPPGRGGIGIVRLSGAEAVAIAMPLLRLREPLMHGQARFARVVDAAAGIVLDEAVVTYFAAPNSYTAEAVVEIAAHGSPVVLGQMVRLCLAGGARLAEPGEFTQRAFLAGRLDLTEAEAVRDLIEASTLEQARVAAAQLGGSLARAVAPAKAALVTLIAALEAGVDFAEDDIDLMQAEPIVERLRAIAMPLQELAASYAYGRVLREGFRLALVGKPNVGKSSLFNRLLGHERAIVTAHPGTTRDPIAERVSLGGVPVELIDTAGLREVPAGVAGEIEAEGIARTRVAMAEADVVLHVLDATGDCSVAGADVGVRRLRVVNKIDVRRPVLAEGLLAVSALTGEGMEALRAAIVALLGATPAGAETALLTNLRQHGALTEALSALSAAERGAGAGLPHEVLLLDLYGALEALDGLTGATSKDEVLQHIFATFCIGK